jgi:hypothetical protein
MKAIIAIGFSLLVATGCASSQMTPEQIANQKALVDAYVEAAEKAGADATIFVDGRVDKIGSFEQSINGPVNLRVFGIINVRPHKVTSPEIVNVSQP